MLIITNLTGESLPLRDIDVLARTRGTNGDYQIKMIAHKTERNKKAFDLITEESIITLPDGNKFRVKSREKNTVDKTVRLEVTALHTIYDNVSNYQYDIIKGEKVLSLHQALTHAFEGTDITFYIEDEFDNHSFENFGDDNSIALFNKIKESFKLEFEIENNTHLRIYKRLGKVADTQLRYKHNIKTIKLEDNTHNLSTYIKGYGKPQEDEEGNVIEDKYVVATDYTSPNADKYGILHATPYYNEKITHKETLLRYLEARLIDEPEMALTVEHQQLINNLTKQLDEIDLGDTLYLIHEPMDIQFNIRINEVTDFPLHPQIKPIYTLSTNPISLIDNNTLPHVSKNNNDKEISTIKNKQTAAEKRIEKTIEAVADVENAMIDVDKELERIENEVIPSVEQAVDSAKIPTSTEPPYPIPTSNLWWDSSHNPPILKRWTGTEWVILAPSEDDIDALMQQMRDEAVQQGKTYTDEEINATRNAITNKINDEIEAIEENYVDKQTYNNKIGQLDVSINDITGRVESTEVDFNDFKTGDYNLFKQQYGEFKLEMDNFTTKVGELSDIDGTLVDSFSQVRQEVGLIESTVRDVRVDLDGKASRDEAIKTVVVEYYLSTSSTSPVGGSWSVTPPNWVNGRYFWSRTKTTYSDGTTSITDPVNITGAKGDRGDKGADGKGIVSATVTYQNHTNGTTAPTGTWSSSVPAPVKGRYLWTRTITNYTDNSSITTYSVSYIATDGQSGSDGKGISSSVVTYQISTSGTTAPTGTWVSSPPTPIKGRYLWTRTVISYTDGTTSTSYSTSYYATDGQKGDTGATGQGVDSITTQYYSSTSKTTQTGGSWVNTQPAWVKGRYLWTRTRIIYKNPTATEYTTPIIDNSWESMTVVETKIEQLPDEINLSVKQGLDGLEIGGANLNRDSNNFNESVMSGYLGNTVTSTENVSVPEWGATDATTINATAGGTNSILKAIKTISATTKTVVGETYTISLYVKNNRDTNISFRANGLTELPIVDLPPNFSGRISVTGTRSTNALQLQFRTERDTQYLNVTLWRTQVEKGNKATDWSLAEEDRVNKTNVLSSINLSTEGVKIEGAKIDIAGLVTVLNADGTPGTMIDGSKLINKSVTTTELNVDQIFGNSAVITKIQSDIVRTSELDAGKITSGTIKADRIGARSITAEKIATGAITAEKISTNGLNANVIKVGDLTGIDIVGAKFMSATKTDYMEITGGNIELSLYNGRKLDISPTGFYGYNQGGSIRFQADQSLVTSAALSTSNSNVYLAAADGGEVRAVRYSDLPGSGSSTDYNYINIRGLSLKSPFGRHLYLGTDLGEVRIMSQGLATQGVYRDVRANKYFGNELEVNGGSILYLRTDSRVRIMGEGSSGSYSDLQVGRIQAHSLRNNAETAGTHFYIGTGATGTSELRVTTNGLWGGSHDDTIYTEVRASGYYGNTLDQHSGVGGSHIYVRPSSGGELRVTRTGTTGTYQAVRASSFPTSSSINTKSNIEKFNLDEAIYLLKHADIYKYHINSNLEGGIYDKPKIGMLSETVPPQLRDEDGVDTYSIVSTLWKVVQHQQEQIENLEQQVNDLYELA